MDNKNKKKKLGFDIAIFVLVMILIQSIISAILQTYFFKYYSGLIGAVSWMFVFVPVIIFLFYLRNKK